MQVSFEALGVVERLDATLETIAFRSISELTANARNHSRGTRGSAITLATERRAAARRGAATTAAGSTSSRRWRGRGSPTTWGWRR